MKNKYIFFGLFLASQLNFAQTQQEIVKINGKIDQKFRAQATEIVDLYQAAKQSRVAEYLKKHNVPRVIQLADGTSMYMVDVNENGQPEYYAVDNSAAAQSTLTNSMYGLLGLNTEGQGMTLGVWDENRALGTHQEFTISNTNTTSRMSYGDAALTGTSTDHATHVSGTMSARGAQTAARGMAFRSNIVSYNWDNDFSEVQTAAGNGILVTNHSYGIPMYNRSTNEFQLQNWRPGCYTSDAAAWDLVHYSNPYTLSMVSAGNEGNRTNPYAFASGLDKLVDNKVSKNNLVIANAGGAVRDAQGVLQSLSINPTSSIGPSDDFRIKPDLAGIGTNVYSCVGTSNTAYETLSGTSMAAPNVTGSLALLQQYYNSLYGSFMRAATLKGLVCLTADDAGSVGPDPYFGWGLLNMKFASDVIRQKGENIAIVEENILNTGQTYTTQITLNTPGNLRAGICWTDYPGQANDGYLNSSTRRAIVNDLDIRVTKDGTTYLPWKLNPSNPSVAIKGDNNVDTVEIIEIEDAPAGVYTITVTAKGSVYSPDNQGQAYSLIAIGSDSTASNKNVEATKVSVYPNPVNDVINVIVPGVDVIEEVSIFDALGKLVLTQKNASSAINVAHLNQGVYIIKAKVGGEVVVNKFIKK